MGGAGAIRRVQSETRRGEIEATGMNGKATFIAHLQYALHQPDYFSSLELKGVEEFDGTA